MSGCLDFLVGSGSAAAQQKQMLFNLKKGKTNDQKDIIDFFLSDGNAGGGCGCLGSGSSPMTVDQYLAKVNEYLSKIDLKSRAMEKLGIDESEVADVNPICLYDFLFDTSDKSLYWKYADRKVVTSKYSVTWIFFSATQMYTYNYIFDMTSDNVTEYMKEFFLQDVTSFETESDLVERIDSSIASGCLSNTENISKNNYTVDWFRVTVPGAQFSISMRNAGEQADSVQAAKALLRDRKFTK